jgi:Leucine-rich repeat (LRR) protein
MEKDREWWEDETYSDNWAGHHLETSFIVSSRLGFPENLVSLQHLTNLSCVANSIAVLPSLPPNLTGLNVANNALMELPTRLPPGLRVLNCKGNRLLQLPDSLPLGITHLDCSDNLMLELPLLRSLQSLTHLECNNNLLDVAMFSVLPECVQLVRASGNRICDCTGISALTSLKTLDLSRNNLTVLDWTALPPTLTELHVNNSDIRQISHLPPGLVLLSAVGNQLTRLPPLPARLRYMDCSLNELVQLTNDGASLPASMLYLNVRFNKLRTLPGDMPPSLEILGCAGNLIKRDSSIVAPETWRLVQEDYREFCARRLGTYCAAVGLEHMLPSFLALA